MASQGGVPQHPQWYRNLLAHREVAVQVQAEHFRARARSVSFEEKLALWQQMMSIWPAYDEYQARTSRDIPVVILERT